VSTNVSVLAEAFKDAGHDVTVVSIDPGPTDGYGYAVVRNPDPLTLFDLYAHADILVLSNLAIRLIYPLLLLRRPFALRHHSESAFRLGGSLLSLNVLRRSVMRRAKHFVTSEYIGRKSGLREYVVTRPFANPHHIDPGIWVPSEQRAGALFAGRLEPEKGILYLLDRWPHIKETLKVSELRIAGDGSLRSAIQHRFSARLDGVRYLGLLPLDRLAQEMARSAFVLVPSLWDEPFGAVALEAVAAGALVVASNRGGLPEATGELGFLYDPDDPLSFQSALHDARRVLDCLLQDPEERSLRERVTMKHVANFAPSAVVDKIITALSCSAL
jgi:glycosyltransferase involved in cell wall biosynthesis